MRPANALLPVYILLMLLPSVLVIVLGPAPEGTVLYEFGRNLALAAFPIIFFQPILTARISWIDRAAGTGNSLRFHKAMGVSALVALFFHPLCLALGGAGTRLLTSLAVPWFVMMGKAALVVLAIHVLLALARSAIGLRYPTWKRVHIASAPLILAGAFVHSWFAGTDLIVAALRVYWIALLILGAAAFSYRRFESASYSRAH
jgi:predicted ferric reductase